MIYAKETINLYVIHKHKL